mgnify:CR=1 FL=1
MSESADAESWLGKLRATTDRFEEENDDLEAILEGDMGFHAYFAVGEDPTRGCTTALFQGFYEVIEEVSVDAEIVEINHGEVTPETVWAEFRSQLHEHTYLSDEMESALEKRVKRRVQKNLEQRGESA